MNNIEISIIIKKSSKYYKKKTLKDKSLIRVSLFGKFRYQIKYIKYIKKLFLNISLNKLI